MDLGEWPSLVWSDWQDTAETLHMLLQIVGKTRLALTVVQNHWWNVPLYLTARGLSTSPMPYGGGRTLDIEFDFIRHELVFRSSTGTTRQLTLEAVPIRQFYTSYRRVLSEMDVQAELNVVPVEVANTVPFDRDDQHASYDAEAVSRFWHVLRLADIMLKEFSTTFYGKISPVHFFWGSMDLAVTRFSGRRAPGRAGADAVQSEAYSHEVISAGFWPGNGGYGQAAFYAYAAPVPIGLGDAPITPPAFFSTQMAEYLLNYADLLQSNSPRSTLQEFLSQTYAVAADAAGWDRPSLDRSEPFHASRGTNEGKGRTEA